MVVAIIIIIAGLATYFPQAWAKLQDLLGLGVAGGSDLEKAIMCAYYRCTKGCKSTEIANLFFNTGPGGQQYCKENFCHAEWTDTGKSDGKICGSNAMQHPVDLILNDESEIEKSHLNFIDCITDLGVGSGWDIIGHCSQFWGSSLVEVNKSYVVFYGEKSGCLPCGPLGIEPGGPYPNYKSVTLSPNSYKIIGVRDSGGVWPFTWDFKKVEIYTEEEFSKITCQKYGDSSSCADGCQWCSLCDDGGMNKFGKDICILSTEDCEYKEPSACGVSCPDFTKESDCSGKGCEWCDKCSVSEANHVNQWKTDKCVKPGTNCGYECVKGECGAECATDKDCSYYYMCAVLDCHCEYIGTYP